MDPDIAIESPLALTRTVRYVPVLPGGGEPDTVIRIGGVVRDKQGAPLAGAVVSLEGSAVEGGVTNDKGEFVLSGVPTGTIRLRVTPAEGSPRSVTLEVPSNSYEVTLD